MIKGAVLGFVLEAVEFSDCIDGEFYMPEIKCCSWIDTEKFGISLADFHHTS